MCKSVLSFVALACLAGAHAQLTGWGNCPSIITVKELDLTKFSGVWYEVLKNGGNADEKCIVHTFDDATKDFKITRNSATPSQLLVSGTYSATPNAPGNIDIVLANNNPFKLTTKYSVLGTDYSNWAMYYTCSQNFGQYTQNMWLLSRNVGLLTPYLVQVDAVIMDNNMNITLMTKTNACDVTTTPTV